MVREEGGEFAADATPGNSTAKAAAAFPRNEAELLGAILDSVNLAAYLKDDRGKYLYVNRQYELLSKVPREMIIGKYDGDFFTRDVARLFRDQDLEVMKQRTVVEFEETITLPDGVFSFITAKFPLIDADGKVYAVGGLCTDITSRKQRSDESFAAERERLVVTLRSIGDGVISTDTGGNVVLINPVAERLTGWRQIEAVGRPLEEVYRLVAVRPGQRVEQLVREALARADTVRSTDDTELVARDGTRRLVTAIAAPVRDRAGRVIGAVLSFLDVTEQRRMTEELFNSRRLESLGMLAGGIAHDFNNMLEGILANIGLATGNLRSPEKVQQLLAGAEKAALRARGLTRQLLTFSRGGQPVKETTSIADLVRDAASFSLSGSNVSCKFEIPDGLWLVDVDRAQLGQVIQNLVINARQAMPGGGTITIRCSNLDACDGRPAADVPPGRYVQVLVVDDGPGIPPEIVGRIFDPYFTTKEAGCGLGLAVSFAIVRKHGGGIFVARAESGGACFRILLPAAGDAVMLPRVARPVSTSPGHRILFMDDDEDIRDVVCEFLQQLGFEVVSARDGREAVDIYRARRGGDAPIDLVVLDLTVRHGVGGAEAMRELRAIDPAVKAIVSSGYQDDKCLTNYREHGFAAAALKPYALGELQERIASVLG